MQAYLLCPKRSGTVTPGQRVAISITKDFKTRLLFHSMSSVGTSACSVLITLWLDCEDFALPYVLETVT